MPIKSAPYYWLECDNCGTTAEYGDFSAWKDQDSAIGHACDWTHGGEKHHCPACPPLDVDD